MIVYDINFNVEYAQSVTEKKFIEHFDKSIFQGLKDDERKARLKEVYQTLKGKEEGAV